MDKNKGLIIAVVILALFGVLVYFLSKGEEVAVQDTNADSTTEEEVLGEVSDAGKIGPNEIALTEANFAAEVENSKGVFLVDFYLSTCPHCQVVAPNVTAASDELVGQAKIGKVEANESPETSSKYNIQSVPTFIVFKDGKEVKREVGEKTKEELIQMVKNYL